MAEPDNIWVKVIQEKYLRGFNLWSYKMKSNTSWQWKQLMKLRPEFEKGFVWRVGDGQTIRL